MAAFALRPLAAGLSRSGPLLAGALALLLTGGSAVYAIDCPPCDDGNGCTVDICDTATGTCQHAFCPDDGNVCTIEQCIGGACVGLPNSRAHCDDHNACTLFDECLGNPAQCVGTQTLNCDDSNPCTADSCSPATGCNHFLISCNDGNPCTDDICGGFPGAPPQCIHRANSTALCDDGRACSQDDHCVAGVCTGTGCPIDCPPCDDGNGCTVDTCDTATGTCQHALCPDDGNPCTLEQCLSGSCVGAPNSGAHCDDANVCTLFDECIGTTCAPGTQQMSCQDTDPCTVDTCDPTTGCNHFLVNCNDDNPCTDDICGGFPGAPPQCIHLVNTAPCDDGQACSQDDHCAAGVCVGTGCPCEDRDGDGFSACTPACDPTGLVCGDCADSDPAIHPGATDLCDGRDDDCDGIVDDPGGTDSDGDGIGDACDNCPTVPNNNQDICACSFCGITNIVVNRSAQGGGIVRWLNNHETGILGYFVVHYDKGQRIQLTPALIPCQQCETGMEALYAVPIAKHKSAQDIYVEQVNTSGTVQTFGPAVRNFNF